MKRNKTLRIATILLALVLVSAIGMAGTLARYIADFDGASVAVRAGRFNVEVDDDLSDAFTWGALLVYDGSNDNEFAESGDDIIVPGSQLRADGAITVFNDSEVAVRVTIIDIEIESFISFLEFSIDEGATWESDVDDLDWDDLTLDIAAGDTEDLEIDLWVRWATDVAIDADDSAHTDYAGEDAFELTFRLHAAQILSTDGIVAP